MFWVVNPSGQKFDNKEEAKDFMVKEAQGYYHNSSNNCSGFNRMSSGCKIGIRTFHHTEKVWEVSWKT